LAETGSDQLEETETLQIYNVTVQTLTHLVTLVFCYTAGF